MTQRSSSLGNTEGIANTTESTRQLTKITTGLQLQLQTNMYYSVSEPVLNRQPLLKSLLSGHLHSTFAVTLSKVPQSCFYCFDLD